MPFQFLNLLLLALRGANYFCPDANLQKLSYIFKTMSCLSIGGSTMRVLRIFLAVICFTICLPAGFVVLFTAFQLNTVIQKSKPKPEETSGTTCGKQCA